MSVWRASWIGPAYHPTTDIGVHVFRTSLQVEQMRDRLAIHISADQRYKLFVNGVMVDFGPQRGDLLHWFYRTVDIAKFLRLGENRIVAVVWNFGRWSPMAQHSARTGFIVQAEDEQDKALDTPGKWEVATLPGWDFDMMHGQLGPFYIDVGPGEKVDGAALPPGWTSGAMEGWTKPNHVAGGEARGTPSGGTPWNLIPSSLPPMLYTPRAQVPRIRRGYANDRGSAPEGPLTEAIQLNEGGNLLLDYGELLCAYPRIRLLGEAGAEVRLTYSESMWTQDGGKGDRSAVEGRKIMGYQDRIKLGRGPIEFEPLWWRTYRYLMIETERQVQVQAVGAVETGYPYRVEAAFESPDPVVAPMFHVSVRTAKRCAGETYFDCPYYEQLQYVGDTRIQVLLHYFLSRDRALPRNSIETLGWSTMENGLTQSRYPSRQPQVIPTFSLYWLLMLHDQLMYDGPESAPTFVTPEFTRRMLDAYRELQSKPLSEQYWQFGDWIDSWPWGMPPGGANSRMCRALLLFAEAAMADYWALRGGATTSEPGGKFPAVRREELAKLEADMRAALADKEQQPCEQEWAIYWSLKRFLGTPAFDKSVVDRLDELKAPRCTYYTAFYRHDGEMPADYLAELGPWKEMIAMNLSTFSEKPEPVRSDCHAWSAHPAYGLLRIMAGVSSVAPGFAKVRIEPRPGSLDRFLALVPHPKGDLRVLLADGKLVVETPVPATLVWGGRTAELAAGRHEVG